MDGIAAAGGYFQICRSINKRISITVIIGPSLDGADQRQTVIFGADIFQPSEQSENVSFTF